MTHLISGRRLAAAILTVTTVTAVAGTLVTAPALAAPALAPAVAPADVTAGTEASLSLPADAEIVSAGTNGFLTARPDGSGGKTFAWTNIADGTVTPLPGQFGYDTGSDTAVTGDGRAYMLRDMNGAGSFHTSIDLKTALGEDAVFVGASGTMLFATKPDARGKLDLYRVSKPYDSVVKQKISYGSQNTGFKILGSGGNEVFILGSAHDGMSTSYFSTTYKLNGTGPFGLYDYTKPVGAWAANATGSVSPAYQAWTERANGTTEASVYNRTAYTTTRFPLGTDENVTVAGTVGDWLLYGLPGGATATSPNPLHALTARSLTGTAKVKLLDHITSSAVAPDGSVLVRGGSATEGEGLYRITEFGGEPYITQVATTGQPTSVRVTVDNVPTVVDLDRNGTTVPMRWSLSRTNVVVDFTLTHGPTGKKFTQRLTQPSSPALITWNGLLDGISAPNGDYTWTVTAKPLNGIGAAGYDAGNLRVVRKANPHDFNDNGSTDVLARDASGVLWRDDLFDWPVSAQITTARRTKVGTGWQTYKQIESVGNIAGSAHGDLIALDGAGYLWHYLGKGDGTFATRAKVGSGWGGYNKLAGGSDLTGDGRADLLATDAAGVLWLYKGTGSSTAPFATRVRVGAGWGGYNQLTAVGNIAGTAAGDLVARDTAGVLWLYQGNGTGGFTTRVRIGSGWGAFSQLVGAGDVDNDGRPDLIAYGAGGTYVYRSTGSATTPFSRMTTNLYPGEGTKFTSVS
ncbi:VCBS repeat-containing protein [Streptomyces sp. NBC_00572]|uniref:FG-GAP repeat domain-containing protein n=1 Tax=Streptomyces sp. NBC_00572 TaxID=2903664 RepID=UPI002250EC81|nr:VCBS repeat-containing protein [Streptomyces sp. NBC_00572]MCX4982695.1 VCBS repeat-containing protein [Streptomyces sp. NBC_00572]